MNVVIIGAGMGGLTTGIALKNLVTKFVFLSKLKRFFQLALQFRCGRMV